MTDKERREKAAIAAAAKNPRSHEHSKPRERAQPKVKELVCLPGDEVYSCEDPPAAPVVEGLFYRGFSLLAGRPKSGKSWLALQAAIAVAEGLPLAGALHVNRGKVLYLALEEPRQRTTARMRQLLAHDEDRKPLANIRFVYAISPMFGGGLQELDAALVDAPADLVIIDTMRAFSRIRGRKDDIVELDYRIATTLREASMRHDTAIVGVDHSRKAPGDVIDSVMGTTGITAGCDAVCGMERTANGDSVLTARGRDHEELSYALRFSKDAGDFGWRVFGTGDDARNSEAREEVILLLKHEAPLQPAKIALLLKRNANTVRSLLYRMVMDGTVLKHAGGYFLAGHDRT